MEYVGSTKAFIMVEDGPTLGGEVLKRVSAPPDIGSERMGDNRGEVEGA